MKNNACKPHRNPEGSATIARLCTLYIKPTRGTSLTGNVGFNAAYHSRAWRYPSESERVSMRLACKKNGQIFSLDFLVAVVAFAAVLISSAVVWDYSVKSSDAKEKRNGLELASMDILSALAETQGNPSNWSALPLQNFNSSNVLSIGFAKNLTHGLDSGGSWVIDRKKLDYINSSTYNAAKNILGLSSYEFNLTLRTYNGTGFLFNYSVSGNFGNSSNIVTYTRYAVIDGKKAEISLKVAANG